MDEDQHHHAPVHFGDDGEDEHDLGTYRADAEYDEPEHHEPYHHHDEPAHHHNSNSGSSGEVVNREDVEEEEEEEEVPEYEVRVDPHAFPVAPEPHPEPPQESRIRLEEPHQLQAERASVHKPEEDADALHFPELHEFNKLKASKVVVGTYTLQAAGMVLALVGLLVLPTGDGAYLVNHERLSLAWFSAVWCGALSAITLVGLVLKNDSWLLLMLLLLGIASTVLVVVSNMVSGFTRPCIHCPGEEGPAMPFHPAGEPCPDHVQTCADARRFYVCGTVLQAISVYSLMFFVAWRRGQIVSDE